MYDELYVADGYTFYKIIYGLSRIKTNGYIHLNKKSNTVDVRLPNSSHISCCANLRLTNCKIKENKEIPINFKKLATISKVRSSMNKEFEFSFGLKDLVLNKVVKEYDLIRSMIDKSLLYRTEKEKKTITLDKLYTIDYDVNLVLDKWLLTDFFEEFKFSGPTWDDFSYEMLEMQSFGEEIFFLSSSVADSSAKFIIKKGQVDKLTNKTGKDQVSSFKLRDFGYFKDIMPAISNQKIEFYLKSNHPFYIKVNFPSINGVFEMWIAPTNSSGYYGNFESEDDINYIKVDE